MNLCIVSDINCYDTHFQIIPCHSQKMHHNSYLLVENINLPYNIPLIAIAITIYYEYYYYYVNLCIVNDINCYDAPFQNIRSSPSKKYVFVEKINFPFNVL